MTSMTRAEMYELHGLLHRLWSKSGTTDYDKREWKRLDELIGTAICTMLGPEAENGGYMRLISKGKDSINQGSPLPSRNESKS